MAHRTMLDRAREMAGKPNANHSFNAQELEELELIVEWCNGSVDTSIVTQILGYKQTGQVCTRAGTVIRSAARAGLLNLDLRSQRSQDGEAEQAREAKQ